MSAVLGAARYYAAVLVRSQRFLPPLLGYLAVLGIVFTDRAAPPAPEFAVSAGALLVLACWLTVAVAGAEDPVQHLVTLTHARGPASAVGGLAVAVATCSAVPLALTIAWSSVLHGPASVAGSVVTGVLAHLAAVCAGIAIGLPCSRLFLPHIGAAVVAALIALGVVLLVPWLPLVNPALRGLAGDDPALGAALLCLAGSACALTLSGAATCMLPARR